jgi:hypothetical protein
MSEGAHIHLQGGAKMPMVGLGLWKIPKDKCADVVFGAISSGPQSVQYRVTKIKHVQKKYEHIMHVFSAIKRLSSLLYLVLLV